MSARPRRPRGRGGRGGHESRPRIRTRELRALELAVLGWSQLQIAGDLGISQAAVSKILKRIETRLLRELTETAQRQRARQTLRLEHLFAEAMRAWNESKADTTRRRQRQTQGDGGAGATVAELVVQNQHGDPRYLDEARKALADQRKIWGLDAPQTVDLRASRNPYDEMPEAELRAELARQARLLAATAPVVGAESTTVAMADDLTTNTINKTPGPAPASARIRSMSKSDNPLLRYLKLQDAVLKREAERSLYSYVRQAWAVLEPDTAFLSNWHIEYLVEHLEAVTAGEITRLLINLPPRYMKSLLVSVLWPTWEWIQAPQRRWIFASYAESLSSKHSVDRRTILQSPWYQHRWGNRVRLASDQNVKHEFMNTRRGHMIATSIGGSITGKGGSRIVVDDPHNPLQAESDAQRETATGYFSRTLSTRLDNKNTDAIVVVMQRLHERDLAALCLDLGFTHVCLPAEAEGHTRLEYPRSHRVCHRAPGDVLWPEREGEAVLAQQKVALGSAAYAGQYQQRPAPAGGLVFQREWFKFYDELPAVETLLQSWDMTFKDSPSSDYVVGLQAARRGADIYLIDRRKGQWAFNETCRQVVNLHAAYPETWTILIEDAANGPAIINALGREVPGIIGVTAQGGKYARAQAAAPLVEAGNIWLPNPRPHGQLVPERAWVDDFLHECCAFPTGAHDDDVDAFTQLVARCLQPGCQPLRLLGGSDPDGGEPGKTFVDQAIRWNGAFFPGDWR